MALKWYIVHTYSGYEQMAKSALEARVKSAEKEDEITDIMIPAEKVVEMVKGEKHTSMRKFFPGYILVKMELNEETWHIVKNTPKVTGFVGGSTNPPALTDEEVENIQHQMEDGAVKPKPKITFEKGDAVSVTDGPFATFAGYVDEVYPEKGKVKVMVSIFGRPTPVELEFFQVKKG
ncbi:MAG: transcription termination/antitermination protein NusG [Deltaproteobacteria bacterium]|uniref:Transcription termination/antitermination protein NusG n=1 Tax=Candidatus Zymogenus saltonus TaxID=2844893 RepID=A0A9D8PN12_9DELT|nr:transcription termination/antitermination protein NusG [Candidatus Zymogenus saltonus]